MASVTAELREGTEVTLQARQFSWRADEPLGAGGTDLGPTPYEILLGSLAACIAITLRLYSNHKGNTYIGKTVGISGGHLTGEDMAASLTKALGEDVQYTYVPPEVYRTFDFHGAEELGNMFQFKRDFQEAYVGARDLDLSRTLNPGIKTSDDWLDKYGDQLPPGS